MTEPSSPNDAILRKKIALIRWGTLALIAILLGISFLYRNHFSEPLVPPPGQYRQLPAFSFTDENGKIFSSDQLKGKVWVADFIFTRCPGQCIHMSTNFHALQDILPKNKDVAMVSFSIDSDYDTPPILSAYGETYGAKPGTWIFLTGDRDKLHNLITQSFLLPIAKTPEERVAVEGGFTHSSRFVLIDRNGWIRDYFEGLDPETPRKLVEAINYLLSEK